MWSVPVLFLTLLLALLFTLLVLGLGSIQVFRYIQLWSSTMAAPIALLGIPWFNNHFRWTRAIYRDVVSLEVFVLLGLYNNLLLMVVVFSFWFNNHLRRTGTAYNNLPLLVLFMVPMTGARAVSVVVVPIPSLVFLLPSIPMISMVVAVRVSTPRVCSMMACICRPIQAKGTNSYRWCMRRVVMIAYTLWRIIYIYR